MFIAVYRWRVRPDAESEHRAGWRRVTEAIQSAYGTWGSRLHRATDGAFVAYAAWPDRATWETARAAPSVASPEALAQMRGGIEGAVEVVLELEVLDDLLVVGDHSSSDAARS